MFMEIVRDVLVYSIACIGIAESAVLSFPPHFLAVLFYTPISHSELVIIYPDILSIFNI